MEQARKHLKISSIVVLIFAGLFMLELVSGLVFGDIASVEGVSEEVLRITRIFVLSISLVMMLPQIYIGIKGLLIAKNPNASCGHIVWAIILFVFSVLSLVSPIVGMFQQGIVYQPIKELFGVLLEVLIYFDYIKYAKAVRAEYR